ncbi:hypothetical protein DSO57_1006092 [Entomophthora muscae]|uniref:Uncharacterized protein n=1 Tax=Entomophthora muscae TaxID=34485 RepID=A0ACC2SX86_9FUNG|nr:hypothetical protein DSO57_1006092 [Entomophthora muscae]
MNYTEWTPHTNQYEAGLQEQLHSLKEFLANAPSCWDQGQTIRRYMLPSGDQISCVMWGNLFFMTGTDIVRSLVFRLEAYGRSVTNFKKFEEGIFSDLRNLKPGVDAILEEPRSEFLELLYRNNCIRTQKKQKVFFWYSVPHDRLFIDAVEREFKRAKDSPGETHCHPLAHHGIPTRMVRFLIGDMASYAAPAPRLPQDFMHMYSASFPPLRHPAPRWSVQDKPEKSHVCLVPNCHRAFKRSDQLRRHQKTHQHPFPCLVAGCPRSFVRHDQLMQHLALNHSTTSTIDDSLYFPLDTMIVQEPEPIHPNYKSTAIFPINPSFC